VVVALAGAALYANCPDTLMADKKQNRQARRPAIDPPYKVNPGEQLRRELRLLESGRVLRHGDGSNYVIDLDRVTLVESEIRRSSLPAKLKTDVLQLLAHLWLTEHAGRRGRGAGGDPHLQLLARIVFVLVHEHGIQVRAAARALVKDAETLEGAARVESIEKAYRRVKHAGPQVHEIPASLVETTLRRIRERTQRAE
jgi:hypothetical protein